MSFNVVYKAKFDFIYLLSYHNLLNLDLGLASGQWPLGTISDSLCIPKGHVIRHETCESGCEVGSFSLFLQFFDAFRSLHLVLLTFGAVSHPVVVTQSRAAHWEADGAVRYANIVVHRNLGV